jgi:pimeloyl-ACP methyl ester carboxylesterase
LFERQANGLGTVVDVGTGPPLVLIPGIQGRWEYLQPAIDALAQSFRVLSFPLAGERGSGAFFDPSLGLDNYTRQIAEILDGRDLTAATICGVSFGGLAAIRFAAAHPQRTAALVLVSTPGPSLHLSRRHRVYIRAPWFFGPLFLIETPRRIRAELRAVFPTASRRWRFALWQLMTLARAPLSTTRMAARAALIPPPSLLEDCALITAPTLIVVGEPGLDRVVRVETTTAYLTLIRHARSRTLEATGHLGSITHPEAFAEAVRQFAHGSKAVVNAQDVPRSNQVSGHALA